MVNSNIGSTIFSLVISTSLMSLIFFYCWFLFFEVYLPHHREVERQLEIEQKRRELITKQYLDRVKWEIEEKDRDDRA